jgi:hypothetical protein
MFRPGIQPPFTRLAAGAIAAAFLSLTASFAGDPAARVPSLLARADADSARRPSGTVLGIEGTRFTLNGKPAFLYGLSYYGALAAPDEAIRRDLDEAQRQGFNWIRVWATWSASGVNPSAVDENGNPVREALEKLRQLLSNCDQRGMGVDVTLSRGVSGPSRLQSLAAHQRAVETLVASLRPQRNWYLDLSNERNIRDSRFTSFEDLRVLRRRVRELDSKRLVTASHGGDLDRDELSAYLRIAGVDFISPHRPRNAESAGQTEAQSRQYLAWMNELGRPVPLHYQEPFRRGYADWNPVAADFVRDLLGARSGGAAGWCFHNGDQRGQPDRRPRRSFDLGEHRLFDQLDGEEKRALEELRQAAR